jgi:hypothetical protein
MLAASSATYSFPLVSPSATTLILRATSILRIVTLFPFEPEFSSRSSLYRAPMPNTNCGRYIPFRRRDDLDKFRLDQQRSNRALRRSICTDIEYLSPMQRRSIQGIPLHPLPMRKVG